MSWRIEKEEGGDSAVVWSGFEKGIAPSPHKGIGNMTAVDINTEQGEVMCSYVRELQTQNQTTVITGTLVQTSTNTISFSNGITPKVGTWITVSGSTISGLSNGTYYVLTSFKLSTTYSKDTASAVTGMGSGTATWTALSPLLAPVAGATERYVNTSGVTNYRYYVVDTTGKLWVKDTDFATIGGEAVNWVLPYPTALTGTCTGMTIAFGFVHIFMNNIIYTVATPRLGVAPASYSSGGLPDISTTTNPHFALAGTQGSIYWTDGPYVGSIFPNISIDPSATVSFTNLHSMCGYTRSSSTAATVNSVLDGSIPYDDAAVEAAGTLVRIPVFFFTGYGGTQPTNLVAGTKYYIECNVQGDFLVYAAQTGGAAINIATGAAGDQYFTTYYPQSSSGSALIEFTPQHLGLPSNEISTTIAELGNTVIVGTQSNKLYPWNQTDPTPSDVVPLPEANTSSMVTVNNVVYVFAGYRGNIYITNGSSVSLALSVPDYTSGLIEPYFAWGGSSFIRGRVYFSIQDQTATHTGQCGGVWSFVPVQNFSYGQDYGQALRMDNKNSYGTFNGKVNVFIPSSDQSARGPQFWSAWISSSTSPTYGIDFSGTTVQPTFPAIIDTDIVPVGTMLNKKTFKQLEYKLAAPLDATSNPESVAISYRTNLTEAFQSAGTVITESSAGLSGYITVEFQNVQWLQLRVTLTPNGDATSSFVRLTEVRAR